jgi:alpha-ribazole phosphatase
VKTIATIDLLRHGETQGGSGFFGSTDIPLTDFGCTQMWNATQRNTHAWDHIITSPLIRCKRFAHELQIGYSIPMIEDERIREIHFGDWEGRSPAELAEIDTELLARFWRNPVKFPPPNAECLVDFEKRVLSAWQDISVRYANQNILLITHGGVIRMILCHILQHPIERLLEFEVCHAAMRRITIENSQNHRIFRLIPDTSE